MVGAILKSSTHDRAGRVISPGARRHAQRSEHLAGSLRWRMLAILTTFVPLSFVLVQCGQAPSAGQLAANAQATTGDSFDDRFPRPVFRDRFPTASESLEQRQAADVSLAPKRAAQPAQPPYRVASLAPTVPYQRPAREDQTTLVSLKSSAFPYFGNNPSSDAPFLNVSKDGRRGHRSYGGRVYWQDQTYNDNRVLMHVPENFDVRKPGVIVVFFHGNGATLERDVRNRQLVPQQISDSGVNAVLLAPQLAVDASDSSAGKFWQPGGLKRFVDESADHLAELYGDPNAAKAFANMPVIIVGYSGVSAYTRYTKRHDRELIEMIREKGIAVRDDMDGPLRPGSVVFVQTPDGVTHRDYVTHAWTDNPVKEVLVKMAAAPARLAASTPLPASR
jgi:hypothetical protein